MIKTFDGKSIEIIEGENGELLFELYGVGRAIGYEKVTKKNDKEYIHARKDRINKLVKNSEIAITNIDNKIYITIDGVRNLITLSHTANKQNFINWLQDNNYVSHKEVFGAERKETVFLNSLNKILKPMGYTLKQQVVDGNYRLDGYIKELDLVIEYDENGHSHYDLENEHIRETYIKSKYKHLIRLTDSKDLYTNIGLVMNKIMEIA